MFYFLTGAYRHRLLLPAATVTATANVAATATATATVTVTVTATATGSRYCSPATALLFACLRSSQKYLNGTKYLKLKLSVDNLGMLKWYVDGSNNVHWDCKGHGGAVFKMGK